MILQFHGLGSYSCALVLDPFLWIEGNILSSLSIKVFLFINIQQIYIQEINKDGAVLVTETALMEEYLLIYI